MTDANIWRHLGSWNLAEMRVGWGAHSNWEDGGQEGHDYAMNRMTPQQRGAPPQRGPHNRGLSTPATETGPRQKTPALAPRLGLCDCPRLICCHGPYVEHSWMYKLTYPSESNQTGGGFLNPQRSEKAEGRNFHLSLPFLSPGDNFLWLSFLEGIELASKGYHHLWKPKRLPHTHP